MVTPEAGQEWDHDTVLARVLGPKGKGGGLCWAKYMPPTIARTLDMLTEMEESSRVNKAELRRILIEVLGDDAPSREAITRHFRGECSCGTIE